MSTSSPVVAIAAETEVFDREIYVRLLELVLGVPVTPYKTEMVFGGRTRVRMLADAFLTRAFEDGVRHALFAIDNDGGLKRRPEHDDTHDPIAEVGATFERANDACSTCLLERCMPPSWRAQGGLLCLAVPVQTIETWLLCLKPHDFAGRPELTFPRRVLKSWLYEGPEPQASTRLALALAALAHPDALSRLRERPSFARFERQALTWAVAPQTAAPAPYYAGGR